jgi:cation diffusion facilitator family transporter
MPTDCRRRLLQEHRRKLALAKRVTAIGMAVCASLASTKLLVGWVAHSTTVFADGLENTSDLFGSGLVLYALYIASKQTDKEHPYVLGRSEPIAGLAGGFLLGASGILICYESFRRLRASTEHPHLHAIWPLIGSIAVKSGSSLAKFAYGHRLGSAALLADAWHDSVEIISGLVTLIAFALTLYDPTHFAAADHWGGFAVGLIVLFTAFARSEGHQRRTHGRDAKQERIERIRNMALSAPGVFGVEKTYTRKSGLQYHVELHLEVDPNMIVQESHDLATRTRFLICEQLDWCRRSGSCRTLSPPEADE